MTNGARHALGVVAGLLLSPLIAAGLSYGVYQVSYYRQNFSVSWVGLGILVVTGVLLALLVSSRLSPLASLIGGLLFTASGLIPTVETWGIRALPDNLYSGELGGGFLTVAASGMLLVLGVLMLVASAFPSRWRGPASRSVAPPSYSPYGADLGVNPQYPGPEIRGSGPQYPNQGNQQDAPQRPGDVTRPMHRE
jgi:hypothetical protein